VTGERLNAASLARLPPAVARPRYDRRAITPGIVHLGIGAFHRAHQAMYVDDALAAGERDWGITGVSLRSGDVREALAPQDGLYTLAVRDAEGTKLRVIGSVGEVLVAPRSAEAVLARMSEPAVRIVSLTVTEKGYCRDAAGDLDMANAGILADLADIDHPRTAIGFLVAALKRRRAAGGAPFTVLSCDNLPANGRTTRHVLAQFAGALSPDLAAFIEGEVACPSTMVDRIVPATTDADRAAVDAALGLSDAWPVISEPFSQWVIEDSFTAGRPRFETAGCEMVADVTPYEDMKLRLLNGAHSSLAYLGALAGLETVAEAIATPELKAFVVALMGDAAATLAGIEDEDIERYRAALLARFANPALKHRLRQIAMDGSQKLPQRLLSAVRARLAIGLPVTRHALSVAAWMTFARRGDKLDDPLAEAIASAAHAGPAALLRLSAIFGDLAGEPRFSGAVTRQYAAIAAAGPLGAAAAAAR